MNPDVNNGLEECILKKLAVRSLKSDPTLPKTNKEYIDVMGKYLGCFECTKKCSQYRTE